ncbi:MAG: hypothetical protein COA41_00485 [Sphingopyxis sp.]|nr:MAG: hypothetical protein COA41_00485 [Sphingopyxis sp.]
MNAAVFDYEYRNAQIYGQLFDFPLVVLYGIANVGNARVMGVEADVRWRSNDIVCICPDYRDFSAIANQVDVAISHPVLIKSGRSVRWPS